MDNAQLSPFDGGFLGKVLKLYMLEVHVPSPIPPSSPFFLDNWEAKNYSSSARGRDRRAVRIPFPSLSSGAILDEGGGERFTHSDDGCREKTER